MLPIILPQKLCTKNCLEHKHKLMHLVIHLVQHTLQISTFLQEKHCIEKDIWWRLTANGRVKTPKT